MNIFFRLLMAVGFAALITACNSDSQGSSNINTGQSTSISKPEQPVYGAELFGHDSDKVLYGKFIVRMKLVSKPGVISSFFLYDNDSWAGGIPWREIDIESIGKTPNALQTNIITGTSDAQIHSEKVFTINDLENYHEYTLIWTPDEVTWLVDGVKINQALATNSQQVRDLRDTPQTYRMNIWVAESVAWSGQFDINNLPLQQKIDWIEYQQYDPVSKEFTFAWRDDFNNSYLDSNRWSKGNWTFEGNASSFEPNNVSVEDGSLVLRLTN